MTKDEIIAHQAALIADQSKLIKQLECRIVELEGILEADSKTSSRPPSSDGFKKQPAFPRKQGGKLGGQLGHKGKTLKMVEPSSISRSNRMVHEVKAKVCSCGHDLTQVVGGVSLERRQVFDLPPQLLEIHEHRVACKHCPECGELHQGTFPKDVTAPVQYGNRVRALIATLSVEHSMPVARIGELFASLTDHALNENTVVSTLSRLSEALSKEERIIKAQLLQSEVAHADESGARVAGKLHWIHTCSTDLFTHFFVHDKRGKQALNSTQSVTKDYRGILVHDCWASYFGLDVSDHGLCGAHLLRELHGLAQHHGRKWAIRMHDLLLYAYKFSKQGQATLSPSKYKAVIRQYQRIIKQADQEEPPPIVTNGKGRPQKTKGRNLMDRLEKYQQQVLNFARLEHVPFTNNLAERDIRPWKTKLKVSGCFRTRSGAQQFARIKGFCSTSKKHGLSVFEQICAALKGASFLSVQYQAT